MILILLTLTFDHVWSSDITDTNKLGDNSLQPINLHEAMIDAAKQTFGKDHNDTKSIKNAFIYNIWYDYAGYVDHSFKYFYSLLFRSALIKAKQDLENIGIDFEAKLKECKEKSSALCTEILKYMRYMLDKLPKKVEQPDDPTVEKFRLAIDRVINDIRNQHKILCSLTNEKHTNIERIYLFIEMLKTELANALAHKQTRWRLVIEAIKEFESDAKSNFEPIASSKFLDKLKIVEGRLECDRLQ